MSSNEEIFISYSHDSVEHIEAVLELSNKLREDGIDCVLDQYEVSPPEGWPRWMDKKIRDAKFVILICTENYYKRVMGEEDEGIGLGIKWEGNLIYQRLYNAGTVNTQFIPIVLKYENLDFIPTPLQGTTPFILEKKDGYEDLYRRLTNQPKAKKPKLGKRKPLPDKPVLTNPSMFITGAIDIDLWNKAKWSATAFLFQEGKPPWLGIAFKNEEVAINIFKDWHERYGESDQFEELRISIIEGPIEGEEDGYSVHICSDPETTVKRLESSGFEVDESLLMMISRINRMNPAEDSKNLENFKKSYFQYKSYSLIPAVISEDGKNLKPLFEYGIIKNKISFRNSKDIKKNDYDVVVLGSGEHKRQNNEWK